MDQISAMRAFVRVVETGNFTRAAATLNIPKTSVTTLVQGWNSICARPFSTVRPGG